MGMFDDLIPAQPSAQAGPPGGMFDDLIPATPPRSLTDEFVSGMPIVGPLVDKAAAAAGAAIQPLFGVDKDKSFSERYARNLEQQRQSAAQYEKQNPISSTAAQIGGGLFATAPLAATGMGARLLGLTGGLPGQVVKGGLSGAAIGGADAALRGENPGTAAAVGGVAGAALPIGGRIIGNAIQGARNAIGGGAAAVPANTVPIAGVNVPLSTGQATGDVTTQMAENLALRGGAGQPAQQVADAFFNQQQAPAIEQARAAIGRGLDQFGQPIATNPQSAAELVSDRVRAAEQASRANYQGLYNEAMRLPGEINAGAFEGIGQKIKGSLSLGSNPVIIDDVTTPMASRAIQDIDNQIAQLRIQNRADPFGAPNPENIVGVNLQGLDQVRKRLVSMASQAERGSADRRATSRVIGAFDDHVEGAIQDGMFTGDDRALDALRDARAAYSQHQQLFKQQGGGDDVGRAMERIIGRNGGDGATPTEVANFLYGNANVGATGLSQRLALRMRTVLGQDSPEWSAIRQGLWSRLSEATEGRIDFGPQKASERIYEFLNGSGKPLATAMFSPQERALMSQYAGLQSQLVPKAGTVNYSNTAPVLRMIMMNTARGIGASLGGAMAGPAGMAAGALGGNAAGKALLDRSLAGQTARSLYSTPQQFARDQQFANQMGRYASIGGRAVLPAINQAMAAP